MNMTTKLMTLLLAMLASINVGAQGTTYEYVPFVREGVKWVCFYDNPINAIDYEGAFIPYGEHYYTLELKGDTVINGKSYKPLHLYSGSCIDEENDTVPVYLREENKIIYGIIPDDARYFECPIGIGTMVIDIRIVSSIETGKEFILYDFNNLESFYMNYDATASFYYCPMFDEGCSAYTDTVLIGNQLRKRLVIHSPYSWEEYIIEGLGFARNSSPGNPFNYFYGITTGLTQVIYNLCHVIEDGKIVHRALWCQHDDPDPESSDYEYVPIVREGVTWVNEKVIVNHGDTTRYYYNYEICGNDTTWPNMINKVFKACYYYTGDKLDVNTDSLIAGLDGTKNYTTCGRNDAYRENIYQNKCLIYFGQYVGAGEDIFLYYFLEGEGLEPEWDNTIEYYLACQQQSPPTPEDQTLTHENFTQVDPVEIEGVTCRRWCYKDENGEPLAYIIEGIGFDSRDMGDLLTPFTRRPDPNADYQEWCGLSHVIKDGKIIYKGMCYNPNVEPVIPGDANGDGEITIADVNSVIDIVIMGGNASHPRMPAIDMNDDGEVTIADVNVIIDIILNNNLIY